MNDVYGNELHVGDTVAYVKGAQNSAKIAKGVVTKIYSSKNGKDEKCSVDGNPHIYSFRVMRLDK